MEGKLEWVDVVSCGCLVGAGCVLVDHLNYVFDVVRPWYSFLSGLANLRIYSTGEHRGDLQDSIFRRKRAVSSAFTLFRR